MAWRARRGSGPGRALRCRGIWRLDRLFPGCSLGPLGVRLMTHQWAQPASQLGDDRGLSEDRSPGTAQKGNGACENWALLIPRLKSVRESGRGIARPFAIYSNCKSTVSSVHGCRVEFFFSARRAPAFFRPTRMRSVGNFGGRASSATFSAPRCTNLVSDHRGGSLVVGDRRNRRRVRRGLARFRLALQSELEHLVHPLYRKNFQSILDVVRDFCQILHVLLRDENG